MEKPTVKDIERFEKYLRRNKKTGCLEWIGYRNVGGYGTFTYNKKSLYSHRLAWFFAGNNIPDGHQVMHNCPHGDNPSCCEVSHLMVGTFNQHCADRAKKGQTNKGKKGLPYGAYRQPQSRCRFGARAGVGPKHKQRCVGSYASAEEASAVATFVRNVALGLIYLGDAPSEKTGWV
jgi:hypothetical protein